MHTKLSKSPVKYALAQVKLSNIENMAERIPELQDKIRNLLPHFKQVNIQSIQLREGQQPSAATLTQWHFMNKQKQTGIILDKQTITIHTSHYDQFQHLLDLLEEVATQFHKMLNFSLFTRLGLRYINLIEDGLAETNVALQGFQLKNNGFDKNQFLSKTETTQRSQEGVMKIQATRIPNKNIIGNIQNVFLPPELADTSKLLSFNDYKTPEQEFLILDIDHFNNDQGDFNVKEILCRFHRLQEASYQAFCQAVGQTNLKDWRGS